MKSAVVVPGVALLLSDAAVATRASAVVAQPHEKAEGGEHAAESHGFLGVPNIVWQTLNLGLFLVVLWWLLRKPVATFFGDRRREVEEASKRAEADRRRAEELAGQINERLAAVEVEIQNLRTHAAKESEAEQAAALKQAEVDAARIVARGRTEVDSRVREARGELTGYAGDLAVEMAEKLLRGSVTPEDQRRLVSEGVVALGNLKKG